MLLPRTYDNLDKLVKLGQVLIIYGPRRSGKTTLVQNYLDETPYRYKLDSGESLSAAKALGGSEPTRDFQRIADYVQDKELIVIDEAQNIRGIGLGLKIIVDQHPNVRVIATGSSSFDLSRQVGEPLTGRKQTLVLYPLSQLELRGLYSPYDLQQKLPDYLIYGLYPSVLTSGTAAAKRQYLRELVDSYLLKDILALERVKSAQLLIDLLRLLAFQVGGQVATSELGAQLGLNVKTVERYLDLLEKTFIIVRLGGFSRNLRSEVRRKHKYYFVDNGIRNALINNFNDLDTRDDIGALWENFVVVERLKKRMYSNIYGSTYFWRTYGGQEIDLVEERDGQLHGFECKWSSKKRPSAPPSWQTTYPKAEFKIISPDNYVDFVT